MDRLNAGLYAWQVLCVSSRPGARLPPRAMRAACVVLAAVSLAREGAAQTAAELPSDRYEPGVLPVLGRDPDVGFIFGAFVQLARFRDEIHPYAWRVKTLAVSSVHDGPAGAEFPYREGFVGIDWAQVAGSPLRLMVEAGYARTTNLGYYGLGNASRADPLWEDFPVGSDAYVGARRTYQFDGATTQVRVAGIYPIGVGWNWIGDAALRSVTTRTYSASLLERERARGAGAGQQLWGVGDYVQPLLGSGVSFDTRDHETVTTRGMFHDATVRCAPRAPAAEPYCGINVTLRGYVPIARERLSVAARLVGDLLSSRAPLLELSRYGGLQGGPSMGGSRGIRGVPGGRLQGRTKLLANLELRSFFLPFDVASQRFALGVASFIDAGRVWVDPLSSVPSLDGSAPGIHWGAGAGPRLRWGDSLVIRADVAYAPLGAELGATPALYVDVEQVM